MAADDPFERRLGAALHGLLDATPPPHPTWATAPAARRVAGRPVPKTGSRRSGLWLLAAALMVALVGTALAVAGGRLTLGPSPSPTVAVVVPPVSASPSSSPVAPSPTESATAPAPSPITSPTCATSFSDGGLTTDPSNPLHSIGIATFPGYDRVTFVATVPYSGISIQPASPPFADAHGQPVTVAGSAFYSVTLAHVDSGQLPGSELDQFGSGVVRELLRVADDRDGSPQWIVGLDSPACVDVFWAKQGSSQAFILDLTAPLAFTALSGQTCLTALPVGSAQPSMDHLQAVQDVHRRDQSVDFRLGALDGVTVKLVPTNPPFERDPSGLPVTVAGDSFWRLVLTGVEGSGLPAAELDQISSGAGPVEVREIGDFEGVQTWIIGLSGPSPVTCAGVAVSADQMTVQVTLTEH